MPIYRVMVEGCDFPGRMFGEPNKLFGFFATRWSEAEDDHTAERAVIESLRAEFRDSLMPLRESEPAPSLHLDEIDQVDAFPDEHPHTGAAWFPMAD
jgi:hypothetical protein